ncbi:exonuclease domain-containing protein [Brachybacterium muris]|uniref:exonuclease domain-containing protein n=1 Tax=Brachybacterium muris TaxID=219301 RepID=UPI00223C0B9F|nr:exonuclease domain-containing protein [Brachybacterium muris]
MGLLDRFRGRASAPSASQPPAPSGTPRFAVIDVETTGLDPERERVLELAILRADEQGRPIHQWVTRFHPDGPVRDTHIHGITDEDVAGAPRFADLAVQIGTALQGLVLVAHNAEFDLAFLQAEFARALLPMPQVSTYCTLQGSTVYLPHLRRRTLAECCAALGVTHQQAHSALGDAYAAAGLLERYLAMDRQTGYDAPLTASRALRGGVAGRTPPAPVPQGLTRAAMAQGADPVPAAQASAPSAPLVITEEFASALEHLHAGHHLFLTGKAGTGKSTLIRHYLEQTDRSTITVAPTGIAALNVDGYTIHRLFSFPLGVTEEHVRGGSYYPGRFAKALKELDTLIVDEASMVRADLFDALSAALELYGPRPGSPFGGVQLVLVGDLYQLPPVVTDHEAGWIEERYGTPFFFSARSFDEDTFPVAELSTVFRQQGDDRLVDLLNAVREGALLEEARAELNRRTDPDFEPGLDEFWLTLATTNRIVGARNRQMLERLPGPVQSFTAQISGDTDGFEKPTEETLRIAVGAQVMLLNNDPLDRWVNGTLGRITAIGADSDGPVVTVLLRDGRTEQVREHTWEITRPSVEGGALVHQVIGTFTQLPMKLAWAITIHKSQGQTLDRVVVDLTGGTFANGQLYVALSRCTSLAGLVLRREVLPRDLKTDQRVRRYLASGTSGTETLGEAYLSVLTVGTTGDRWRPRPVEIAVVTDDGDEVSTVVNPTSDLFSARDEFGITTRDVQLAPRLAEAWPALSALLAGRVPVGVDIDRQLAHIDFELKRNGIVEPVPLGLEVPGGLLGADERARLNAPTALERARAVRDAVRRVRAAGEELPGSGMAFRQVVAGHGYLLARTTGPTGTSAPTGFVVGGNLGAQDDAAEVLAHLLEGTWQRVLSPDQEVLERLRGVEEHFGVRVLPEGFEATGPISAADVLVPGARVCFSGTVHSPRHGWLEKEQLHAMAEARGLRAVPTLTKTRTDVLVVAEAGSQSSKAKNAAKWEKPVLTAEEFLEWVG